MLEKKKRSDVVLDRAAFGDEDKLSDHGVSIFKKKFFYKRERPYMI